MSKGIFNLKFNLNYNLPVIIVLEAFDASWKIVHNLCKDLISAFPGRIQGIYFLGNKNRYFFSLVNDFVENAPRLFSQNKNRVLLLNPILEGLKDFLGHMVVICSKPPVDLEDWIDTQRSEQVLFINVGDESFPDELNTIKNPNINDIRDRLINPVKRIWISGSGFVPLAFEVRQGGNAKVHFENGKFQLQIEHQGVSLELHLKAIADNEPCLYIQKERGKVEKIRGEEENPWFRESAWEVLDENIISIIEAGIGKTDFTCLQCGNKHPYNTLICPEGSLLLKNIPSGTSILFKKIDGKLHFFALNNYAHSLKDRKRIITRDGKVYDWEGKRWNPVYENICYEEVDNEVWALYHRVR